MTDYCPNSKKQKVVPIFNTVTVQKGKNTVILILGDVAHSKSNGSLVCSLNGTLPVNALMLI